MVTCRGLGVSEYEADCLSWRGDIYWTTGTSDVVVAWRDFQMHRSVVCANDANRVVVSMFD